MTQYAIMTDLNKCVGCLACSVACKVVNGVPVGSFWNKGLRIGPNPKYEGAIVPDVEMYFLPLGCQHCENPECVKVCPTGASHKLPDGTVQIDKSKCIGCQFCAMRCPYGVRYLNEMAWLKSARCASRNSTKGSCRSAWLSAARVLDSSAIWTRGTSRSLRLVACLITTRRTTTCTMLACLCWRRCARFRTTRCIRCPTWAIVRALLTSCAIRLGRGKSDDDECDISFDSCSEAFGGLFVWCRVRGLRRRGCVFEGR